MLKCIINLQRGDTAGLANFIDHKEESRVSRQTDIPQNMLTKHCFEFITRDDKDSDHMSLKSSPWISCQRTCIPGGFLPSSVLPVTSAALRSASPGKLHIFFISRVRRGLKQPCSFPCRGLNISSGPRD